MHMYQLFQILYFSACVPKHTYYSLFFYIYEYVPVMFDLIYIVLPLCLCIYMYQLKSDFIYLYKKCTYVHTSTSNIAFYKIMFKYINIMSDFFVLGYVHILTDFFLLYFLRSVKIYLLKC
jgi:hypothetical protein